MMSISYPTRSMLAVALNPCPCGYCTDTRHKCSCKPEQIQKYMARISGPLLDRIDIYTEVPALTYEELTQKTPGRDSESMRTEVNNARAIQSERFKESPMIFCNAHMESRDVRKYCDLDESCRGLLKNDIEKLGYQPVRTTGYLKFPAQSPIWTTQKISSQHISQRRYNTEASIVYFRHPQ